MVKPVKKGAAKKRAPAKKAPTKKVAAHARAMGARAEGPPAGQPESWWFPTEDPNIVEECFWNPAEHKYNRGCQQKDIREIPPHVRTAIRTHRRIAIRRSRN
jgi:hypothetical protein